MNILITLGIALGLPADAFSVAITQTTTAKNMPLHYGLRMALFFGAFQFFMPIIGWAAGIKFVHLIAAIDHWIAFALLSYVGGKMIWESMPASKKNNDGTHKENYKNLSTLLLLSVATNIDALAVGLSLAMIRIQILFPSLIIGITAFTISMLGYYLGKKIGKVLTVKPDLFGGLILIGIGIKILIEHLSQ